MRKLNSQTEVQLLAKDGTFNDYSAVRPRFFPLVTEALASFYRAALAHMCAAQGIRGRMAAAFDTVGNQEHTDDADEDEYQATEGEDHDDDDGEEPGHGGPVAAAARHGQKRAKKAPVRNISEPVRAPISRC